MFTNFILFGLALVGRGQGKKISKYTVNINIFLPRTDIYSSLLYFFSVCLHIQLFLLFDLRILEKSYDGFNSQLSLFFSTQLLNQDGDPVRPGVAMTDLATGLYACGAIMAGLIQRYKTGKGLFIDCNLLSSQVPIQITFQIMQ